MCGGESRTMKRFEIETNTKENEMSVKAKIKTLLTKLNEGVIEKEDALALTLLSAIAGESIFFLGAPGVAKSLIARKLKYAFKEARSYEYLMNRFSTPDEIFGPVSISKLKDQDKYERITKNYLPSAAVVFLDEIWKAGPSIQNALLTVLNEKIYRNGEQEIKIPMKALISASNELPAKNEGLEALWDRFLVRLKVEGVMERKNFNDMISKTLNSYEDTVSEILKISEKDYEEWSKSIDQIEMPENIFNVIHVIRGYIEKHNKKNDEKIYVSDRRWRKTVRLLRTSAFLNARKAVDLMDCFLIKHCVWDETDQIDAVNQFVTDAIQKFGYSIEFDFESLKGELKEFKVEIKEETRFEKDTKVEVLVNARSDYYEIIGIGDNNNLLRQIDFQNLTNNNTVRRLYYWYQHYNQVRESNYSFNIRKGDSKHTVFINDKEYNLKTRTDGEKRKITKKPHKKVEESWDLRVNNYLEVTNNFRKQLEDYKNKDLMHLRTNLFVSPEYANIVETHLTDTQKEIDKLEVEIRKIQNDYKKLKDEEVVEKI